MTILDQILERKRAEVQDLSMRLKNAHPASSKKDFKQALLASSGPSLIAEIKRKSPSKGALWEDLDPVDVADTYVSHGAAAISVLTDELFFGGSLSDLQQVSRESVLPVLRKDFILCEEQILDARLAGADAVLLMVSVLKNAEKIRAFREYAAVFNMDCLVEVHDAEELQVALKSGADIIGVNARKFKDLSVNQDVFQDLLSQIPEGIVRVAESGFHTREDIVRVQDLADAVLIGTSFMQDEGRNLEAKLHEFFPDEN